MSVATVYSFIYDAWLHIGHLGRGFLALHTSQLMFCTQLHPNSSKTGMCWKWLTWSASRSRHHPWTRDHLQISWIKMVWRFCQSIDAQPPVIGVALIRVLLGDLYKWNDRIPWALLQSDQPPGRLVGAQEMKTFCHDLATKKKLPCPLHI